MTVVLRVVTELRGLKKFYDLKRSQRPKAMVIFFSINSFIF